jgi:hypothetical protein
VQHTMSELREIRLPFGVCAEAEKKFGKTFGGVEELVLFLLEELIKADTTDLDRSDQAMVEERLRELGYI